MWKIAPLTHPHREAVAPHLGQQDGVVLFRKPPLSVMYVWPHFGHLVSFSMAVIVNVIYLMLVAF